MHASLLYLNLYQNGNFRINHLKYILILTILFSSDNHSNHSLLLNTKLFHLAYRNLSLISKMLIFSAFSPSSLHIHALMGIQHLPEETVVLCCPLKKRFCFVQYTICQGSGYKFIASCSTFEPFLLSFFKRTNKQNTSFYNTASKLCLFLSFLNIQIFVYLAHCPPSINVHIIVLEINNFTYMIHLVAWPLSTSASSDPTISSSVPPQKPLTSCHLRPHNQQYLYHLQNLHFKHPSPYGLYTQVMKYLAPVHIT